MIIPEGVLVAEVIKDGAADKAGIEEKNIITEFDGKRVRSIEAWLICFSTMSRVKRLK